MSMKMTYLAMALIIVVTALVAIPAFAITAFYRGESVSGMSKICYYDALGDRVAITIGSTQLCPLTIEV